MLNILEINDYQSLWHLKLRFKRFTVITGPTGSGKSAVLRAIRLLAFNELGTSYIRTGAKRCEVLASDGSENWAVSITRSSSRGSDKYLLLKPGLDQPIVYTKLGGKTPEEVTQFLGLTELNFASQFDRPFLLAESGAEVARVLGRLTNVTLLFNAARESNTRRLRAAHRLEDARQEEARLKTELQRYAGLPQRVGKLDNAAAALQLAQGYQARADRLRALLGAVTTAQATLQSVVVPPPVPSLTGLQNGVAWVERLRNLILATEIAHRWLQSCTAEVTKQQQAEAQAEADLHKLLSDAGYCPLCGQVIKEN